MLDGYRHEQLQGIDTHVGRIWKTDGPQINYDIGQLAGNHARGADAPLWSKRQTIGGHALTLTRLDARSMVLTFDRDTANFFVQGLKTEEDFADVLLMLLSYTPGVR